MAQRRSPSSRKSKAKSKTQSARVKAPPKKVGPNKSASKKAAPKSRIKAKAKLKAAPKVAAPKTKSKKSAAKASKANARRTAPAAPGRKPQRKAGGRRQGYGVTAKALDKTAKAGKVGVETRPEDLDARKRDPGFVYEAEPRQSTDESFSPGNYEPGNVGEPKTNTRRRGVAGYGDSETETTPAAGSRSTPDGGLVEDQPTERPPSRSNPNRSE